MLAILLQRTVVYVKGRKLIRVDKISELVCEENFMNTPSFNFYRQVGHFSGRDMGRKYWSTILMPKNSNCSNLFSKASSHVTILNLGLQSIGAQIFGR